jgi:hypothetical protein
MKRLLQLSIVGLALAVSGCQDEAEETPDITEAIPLDTEPVDADDLDQSGDDTNVRSGENPNLPDGDSGTGRGLPDTMESGSNPSDMTEPPAGSKVQRID